MTHTAHVHTFRDKDIDEIFVIHSPKNTLLHISYLGLNYVPPNRGDILHKG